MSPKNLGRENYTMAAAGRTRHSSRVMIPRARGLERKEGMNITERGEQEVEKAKTKKKYHLKDALPPSLILAGMGLQNRIVVGKIQNRVLYCKRLFLS